VTSLNRSSHDQAILLGKQESWFEPSAASSMRSNPQRSEGQAPQARNPSPLSGSHVPDLRRRPASRINRSAIPKNITL